MTTRRVEVYKKGYTDVYQYEDVKIEHYRMIRAGGRKDDYYDLWIRSGPNASIWRKIVTAEDPAVLVNRLSSLQEMVDITLKTVKEAMSC